MTEFNKTKISFSLALLGTMFVLHPYVEKYGNRGFMYLNYHITIFYVYAVVAGLFAFSVYCYALALVSDRPHSFMEATGNYSYAIALLVPPLVGGLYFASLLAAQAGAHWAVSAPAVALGLGLGWFCVWQLIVWLFRKRMGEQDRVSKVEDLARQEITSLDRARDLFDEQHYDLSVIEAWKALEARLRRVLLIRDVGGRLDDVRSMVKAAARAGLLTATTAVALDELRRQWNIAVSTEPLTREAAEKALQTARDILSTIPLERPQRLL